MTHPVDSLDELVHQRYRLGILTIASETEQVEFTYLRDTLELSAGNLSRHLSVLESAGLVAIEKGYAGRRPKTWIRLTKPGHAALAAEIAALERIVRRHRDKTSG